MATISKSPTAAQAVPAGYRRRARWSKEQVLKALQEWADENGRAPRAEDWSELSQRTGAVGRWEPESPRWPCPTTVRRYFGSWSAALEQAGLRRSRLGPWELSLPERVEAARALPAERVRTSEIARQLGVSAATIRKYLQARRCRGCDGYFVSPGARQCHRCAMRAHHPTPSVDEVTAAQRAWAEDRAAIIAALRAVGARHGRRPAHSDFEPNRPGLPSNQKIASVFGSFSSALSRRPVSSLAGASGRVNKSSRPCRSGLPRTGAHRSS